MKYIAFLALIIIACAPVQPGTQEQVPAQVPQVEPEPEIEEPEVRQEPEPFVPSIVANEEIVQMTEKAGNVKGYSYILAPLPEKSGQNTYYVRDGRVKIELLNPLHMGDWSADYVYIDYDGKTAMAYCINFGSCKDDRRAEPVSFDEWATKLPEQWLQEVQYGTIEGAQQFNNRQVAVVRWADDGLHYEAFLDTFYGLPQRVAVATDDEFTNIVGGFEYQHLQTNAVHEEEVLPPY